MTTAAELRAAAEDARMKFSPDCSVDSVCDHILATVHADDDEPAEMFKEYETDKQRIRVAVTGVGRIGIYLTRLGHWNHEADECRDMFLCDVKTKGDVRRVAQMLGIPLHEAEAPTAISARNSTTGGFAPIGGAADSR